MFVSLIFLAASVTPPADAPVAAQPSDDEIVCKSERIVGSNLGQRVCKTRAKWAEERTRSKEGMRDVQNRGRAMPPRPGKIAGGS